MTTSLERDSTSLERDTLYKQAFSEANDHWPLRPWVVLGGCGGGGGGTGGTGGGGGGGGPRQGAGQGRMSEKGQYFCHRLALWEMSCPSNNCQILNPAVRSGTPKPCATNNKTTTKISQTINTPQLNYHKLEGMGSPTPPSWLTVITWMTGRILNFTALHCPAASAH